MLDAPVSGRPPNMTVMVGGRDADFGHCRGHCSRRSPKNVFHVGPSGAGCDCQAGDAISRLHQFHRRHRRHAGRRQGRDRPRRVGADRAGQRRTEPHLRQHPARRVDRLHSSPAALSTSSPRTWIWRCQLAREVGARAALGALASDVYKRAQAQGWGRQGFPVVARILEAMAGVEIGRRRAMSDRDDRIARLLLTQEIAEFLYREAELLDERRYDEWLALFADDIRYWMPMRRNVKYGEERARVHPQHDRHQLVRRRQGHAVPPGQADPDRHPLGRGAGIAHLAPGVERAGARGDALRRRPARSHGQMPLPDLPQPGRDRDRHPGRQARGPAAAQGDGDDWRIARRKIILDQNVLLSKNLTFFFTILELTCMSAKMDDANAIAEHWGKGDVYGLILAALRKAGKDPDALTLEDLAPIDHYHARGFPATVELADRLTITCDDHILDIGCGLGGPARYFAARFRCKVSGIDITPAFVDAARKLTALVGMVSQVTFEQGDGQRLPYQAGAFDGAYTQHVTMNIADRTPVSWRSLPGAEAGCVFRALGTWFGARRGIRIFHYRGPWMAAVPG